MQEKKILPYISLNAVKYPFFRRPYEELLSYQGPQNCVRRKGLKLGSS